MSSLPLPKARSLAARLQRGMVVAAVVLLISAVLATVGLVRNRASVLRCNQMEQVVEGMTRTEVVALLGGPPGDYRTDPERFTVDHHSLFAFGYEEWIADEAKAEVWFDENERVVDVRVCHAIDRRPTRLKRLVTGLRVEWERLGTR